MFKGTVPNKFELQITVSHRSVTVKTCGMRKVVSTVWLPGKLVFECCLYTNFVDFVRCLGNTCSQIDTVELKECFIRKCHFVYKASSKATQTFWKMYWDWKSQLQKGWKCCKASFEGCWVCKISKDDYELNFTNEKCSKKVFGWRLFRGNNLNHQRHGCVVVVGNYSSSEWRTRV